MFALMHKVLFMLESKSKEPNIQTIIIIIIFTFSYLADTFIQSDLQMRTKEAIKTNKRATICKRCDKSWWDFFIYFFYKENK